MMLTKGQVKKMLTSKAAPPHWFRVGGGWGGGCGGAWGTQWWAGRYWFWALDILKKQCKADLVNG